MFSKEKKEKKMQLPTAKEKHYPVIPALWTFY